ncbi:MULTISPECIES: nucleotidyltransferase family protein [unclassified Paenibacillus]|uniref:nucleotidyltransferase family protein n=1 Tax=unclassified Paenibacillus TaxID=185978 RepID=UPI001AE5F5FA|nr:MULTISPECIES: nucleotidyltransferase family protein [unclassified Paenibacillus]MBP1155663.1 molybdenum cofactor cytidylyltransferase [Paenibacillus sp. PvP091]MBP1168951.1 molybdenum cofactor cytidylyltransferase [Paenibacillus sp. PvR098]MBP2439979.1 molybdenum cofactor cytidylyltransferase [Paenibacillus sp. PvP052]
MKPIIVGIYLAAGAGKRMGGAKLSIELTPGERLGGFALEEALRSSLDRTYVVTRGGWSTDWLPSTFYEAEASGRAQQVVCWEAEYGMSHSLRSGLMAACAESEPEAVVVMLADQPLIKAEMIDRMIRSFQRNRALDYCAAGHLGLPKPPVLLSRTLFPVIGKLAGDEGARSLFMEPHYFGMIQEELESHRFIDADTAEDLERIRLFR